MNLFLIDAISPFFIDYQKRVVNWSKIPFINLERGNGLDEEKLRVIYLAFERFLQRISEIGYNAITLDDIAHLIDFDFYPAKFKSKIQQYQDMKGKGKPIFLNPR